MMVESLPIIQQTLVTTATLGKVATTSQVENSEEEEEEEEVEEEEKEAFERTLTSTGLINGAEVRRMLNSVALDWTPLRHCVACAACGVTLSGANDAGGRRRTHCRRCGRVFCQRCSLHRDRLPGHHQEANEGSVTTAAAAVAVCNACHKALNSEERTCCCYSYEDMTDEDI